MDQLDNALARLGGAIEQLEKAVDDQDVGEDIWGEESAEVPAIVAERDDLANEVRVLRDRAEQDAALRAEAATAVRQALNDLRGAVGRGVAANA